MKHRTLIKGTSYRYNVKLRRRGKIFAYDLCDRFEYYKFLVKEWFVDIHIRSRITFTTQQELLQFRQDLRYLKLLEFYCITNIRM